MEGGRKGGRKGGGAFPGETQSAGYGEIAKKKKKGKHRGGLSRAEVLPLQGRCIFQGQTDRNKTLAVHILTYKTLDRSRHYRAGTDINMQIITTRRAAVMCKQKQVRILISKTGGQLGKTPKASRVCSACKIFLFPISFFCQAYLFLSFPQPCVSLFYLTLLSPSLFSSCPTSGHRLVCQLCNRAAIVSKSAATGTSNLLKSLGMCLDIFHSRR